MKHPYTEIHNLSDQFQLVKLMPPFDIPIIYRDRMTFASFCQAELVEALLRFKREWFSYVVDIGMPTGKQGNEYNMDIARDQFIN